MSVSELEPRSARNSKGPSRGTGGRVVVIILLVASLIATSFTRDWAIDDHAALRSRNRMSPASSNTDTSFSSMPSFATALLLGGLRGPLVMILWTSSENQKQQHDLEDFDTKVEWIRLLQPEFDTVHLFQIWNKAYNISVQMASLANKYTTILDAIDYGQKVEKERPDDINIISAVAMLYGDKLGTSQEHVYYRARIRRESQTLIRITFPASRSDEFQKLAAAAGWTEKDSPLDPDQSNQTIRVVIEPIIAHELQTQFGGPGVEYTPETLRESQQNDPTWRRVRLDPIVDENGMVLPALLTPRYPRPADLPASAPWYDGSPWQFLAQYQPYPYGVSTLALAYNDYKQAQLLQSLWGQHHIQSGDTVVDARPALTLKDWAKDEWERARHDELQLMNIFVPESTDPQELERPTAGLRLDQPVTNVPAYNAGLFSFAKAAELFHDARGEFQTHIANYKSYDSVYFVHIDDSISGQYMMQGDYDFLAALTAKGDRRKALIQSAADNYQAARVHYALTVLKFYIDDFVAVTVYPKDPKTGVQYIRKTIETADPSLYLPTLQAAIAANAKMLVDPATHQYSLMRDTFHDDREGYMDYMAHCGARLLQLQALGAKM